MKKQEIRISENLIQYNLVKDFFKVHKSCRESYYYLKSLEIQFKEHITVLKHNEKAYKVLINEIELIKNNYESLDYKIVTTNNGEDKGITPTSLLEDMKESIIIHERIDELQLEVLSYFIDNELKLQNILFSREPLLKRERLSLTMKYLHNSAFNHSHEEDKILNIEIDSKHGSENKNRKFKGVESITRLKVRDHTYMLTKKRSFLQSLRENNIELLNLSENRKRQKELEEIKEEQLKISKYASRISTSILVIGILSIILSIIKLFISP